MLHYVLHVDHYYATDTFPQSSPVHSQASPSPSPMSSRTQTNPTIPTTSTTQTQQSNFGVFQGNNATNLPNMSADLSQLNAITTPVLQQTGVHYTVFSTGNSKYLYMMLVPSSFIGSIIGRDGRNIRNIRRQSNAEIKIGKCQPQYAAPRYVTITGTIEQIQAAVRLITSSMTAAVCL